MLVWLLQRGQIVVAAYRIRAVAPESRDQLAATAGVAGHAMEHQGCVGRQPPRIPQWAQQAQRAGGKAAGVGYAHRAGNALPLAGRHFWKTIAPARTDTVRHTGIEQ